MSRKSVLFFLIWDNRDKNIDESSVRSKSEFPFHQTFEAFRTTFRNQKNVRDIYKMLETF